MTDLIERIASRITEIAPVGQGPDEQTARDMARAAIALVIEAVGKEMWVRCADGPHKRCVDVFDAAAKGLL